MKRLLSIFLLSFVVGCGTSPYHVKSDSLNKYGPGDRVKLAGDTETYFIGRAFCLDGRWYYEISNGMFKIDVGERELVLVDEFNPGTQHLHFNLLEPPTKITEPSKTGNGDRET